MKSIEQTSDPYYELGGSGQVRVRMSDWYNELSIIVGPSEQPRIGDVYEVTLAKVSNEA